MKKSVKLTYKDDIMSQTYNSLRKYGDLRAVHVPHSTVHYIRALIQRDTGVRYSLSRVENAMKAEGWHEQGTSAFKGTNMTRAEFVKVHNKRMGGR